MPRNTPQETNAPLAGDQHKRVEMQQCIGRTVGELSDLKNQLDAFAFDEPENDEARESNDRRLKYYENILKVLKDPQVLDSNSLSAHEQEIAKVRGENCIAREDVERDMPEIKRKIDSSIKDLEEEISNVGPESFLDKNGMENLQILKKQLEIMEYAKLAASEVPNIVKLMEVMTDFYDYQERTKKYGMSKEEAKSHLLTEFE